MPEKDFVRCVHCSASYFIEREKLQSGRKVLCASCNRTFLPKFDSPSFAMKINEAPINVRAQEIAAQRAKDEQFKQSVISIPSKIASAVWWAAGQLALGYKELAITLFQAGHVVFTRGFETHQERASSHPGGEVLGKNLIDCPACNNEISRAAKACPKCGHPIAAQVAPPNGCSNCGASLAKVSESDGTQQGVGCILCLIGLGSSLFFGLGIPVLIFGFYLLFFKKKSLWRCSRCTSVFPR